MKQPRRFAHGIELVTAEEMRRIDERATAVHGVPVELLMEVAGYQVARVAWAMLHGFLSSLPVVSPDLVGLTAAVSPLIRDASGSASRLHAPNRGRGDGAVTVAAGRGNNGGDGLVAARYLHDWGVPVRVVLAGEPDGLRGAPAENWRRLQSRGVSAFWRSDATRGWWLDFLRDAGLVVDAICGTGLTSPLFGAAAEAAAAINESARPVLSVDIPSGLLADGAPDPGGDAVSVRADVTVTLCRPKVGMMLYPGAALCGEVIMAGIPIPEEAIRQERPGVFLVTPEAVSSMTPLRLPAGHKGTFGHVLVIAGAVGYSGAPVLAALGALRSGAGMVTLAAPEALRPGLEGRLTEVMVEPLPAGEDGRLSEEAWGRIEALLPRASAVVAGPGLGQSHGVAGVLRKLLLSLDKPLVLDADGLNMIRLEDLHACRAPVVLTPHPGEMARLIGGDASTVQANRLGAVRQTVARAGGRASAPEQRVCVLKGARTLIADSSGTVWVNPTGNDGMATAGSGDVLAGLIGGLLAQGAPPRAAAVAGVYLHGLAGDFAAVHGSKRSMAAGDIVANLGRAFSSLGL